LGAPWDYTGEATGGERGESDLPEATGGCMAGGAADGRKTEAAAGGEVRGRERRPRWREIRRPPGGRKVID